MAARWTKSGSDYRRHMNKFRLKATGGGSQEPLWDDVRRSAVIFGEAGAGMELRVAPHWTHTTLAGADVEAAAGHVRTSNSGSTGIYFIINPVPVGLGRPARDADVIRRRWLLIDFDRGSALKEIDLGDGIKAGSVSATDTEKEACREVADAANAWLGSEGWPAPIVVDSGNGYHLYYAIDLPNDAHSKALLKRFFAELGKRVNTAAAGVDEKLHNASRLSKLPGTWARKGKQFPDRPHRCSRLLYVPDDFGVVTAEQLAAAGAGAETPEPAPTPTPRPAPARDARRLQAGGNATKAYARSALRNELARVALCPAGGRDDQLYKSAAALGNFMPLGLLDRADVELQLYDAAGRCGLIQDQGAAKCRDCIRRALDEGATTPRVIPERAPSAGPSVNGRQHAAEPDGNDPPARKVKAGETIIYRASEVTPRKVEWLWPGRIPLGKLTTFAGVGGLGKTFVLCDITARVTRGLPWPDETDVPLREPAQVMFVSGEDDPEDTLVPRLIELGANLDRVIFLKTEVQDYFTLADIDTLDVAIGQAGSGVRFVAIDPPTAYLGGVDDHKNAELRGLLSPLKSWAQRNHLAVVFNTHVNKGSGGKVEAMMRVMGSVAWINAVRAAHMFARDPDDRDRRLCIPMKMNLAKERKGLAYRIVEVRDLARVEWLGEVDISADDAMNKESRQSPRRKLATEWMVDMFRVKLEWASDDFWACARQHGITRYAIDEARVRLNMPKPRVIVSTGGDKSWIWWVPADWAPLQNPVEHGKPIRREHDGQAAAAGDRDDEDDEAEF